MSAPPPALFSSRRREAQRQRSAFRAASGDFIAPLIAESLLDRLAIVTRDFERPLLIAPRDHDLADGRWSSSGNLVCADTIDTAPNGPFDLIVWPGGLEAVNDVPGAMVQARARLIPDGLMIGALIGDGSFALLRRMLVSDGMRAIPRMHPQIDLKTLGNLFQRVGFTLPVCDVEALTLRYRDWRTLVADLRGAGLANQLANAPPPLTRAELSALDRAFAAAVSPDGRADETLRLMFFTVWAPHPDQPQPARRGSGKSSLAAALREISPDQPDS